MRDHTEPCRLTPGDLLADLAFRLDRLQPDHRNPESFHEEKSEISYELLQLAVRLG